MNKFCVWLSLAVGNFGYAYFMHPGDFREALSWTVAQAVAIAIVALFNA